MAKSFDIEPGFDRPYWLSMKFSGRLYFFPRKMDSFFEFSITATAEHSYYGETTQSLKDPRIYLYKY